MNAAAIASPEDHCLEGQAVVITGAARGLGAAYARLAAAEGARVVVNDIDAAGAEAVAAQICSAGGEACASGANIARWDHAAALVQLCVDRYGAIDGLVNNAALFRMARPEEEEAEAVRALIEVNVLGTLHCGVHALRHMLLRRRGSIVNITSGAQAGSSLQGAYGASKGAVASLTYSWALDCAASGVRVNAFAPMARTAMADTAQAYLEGHGLAPWPQLSSMPEDNAPAVVFMLSPLAAGMNGQVLRLDGGRLSLMTHPAVLHPPLEREHWSIAELQAAWSSHFAQRQLPLGVVAAEWSERAYALPYRRAAEGSGPRSDGERKPHA
jgi:NAD(P)-dependent dehydrogenase (short-subunit alcohol dehydrogenase family)